MTIPVMYRYAPVKTFAAIHKFLGFNEKPVQNAPYPWLVYVDEVTYVNLERPSSLCLRWQ